MAAEYSPNTTWPIEKLALQKKILGYEGIHVTFENGRRYPGGATKLRVPQPLYIGDTLRVFCYTGDLSGTNIVGVYYSNTWLAQIEMIKPAADHATMQAYWFLESAIYSGREDVSRARAHDIHSLAFRVEANGHFMFYHDEVRLKPFNFKTIIGYEFYILVHLESHYVLSYHVSQETNDPFPELSRPYINAVSTSVGSYVECTLIFNGPRRDLQVTQSGSSVTFTAPGTLTPGETVQCILRISFSGYVASASFNDTPLTIKVTSPQFLEPTFSGDFSLRKAHTHVAD